MCKEDVLTGRSVVVTSEKCPSHNEQHLNESTHINTNIRARLHVATHERQLVRGRVYDAVYCFKKKSVLVQTHHFSTCVWARVNETPTKHTHTDSCKSSSSHAQCARVAGKLCAVSNECTLNDAATSHRVFKCLTWHRAQPTHISFTRLKINVAWAKVSHLTLLYSTRDERTRNQVNACVGRLIV